MHLVSQVGGGLQLSRDPQLLLNDLVASFLGETRLRADQLITQVKNLWGRFQARRREIFNQAQIERGLLTILQATCMSDARRLAGEVGVAKQKDRLLDQCLDTDGQCEEEDCDKLENLTADLPVHRVAKNRPYQLGQRIGENPRPPDVFSQARSERLKKRGTGPQLSGRLVEKVANALDYGLHL